MAGSRVEDTVASLVMPIVERNSFELVDVEFIKEGAYWYLRVYIDKTGGVTLDDCQLVSEELSARLDRVDPIKQSYFLEVSSPGLNRPLKTERDFERYRGEQIELKLYAPLNGKKTFEGELIGLQDGKILIKQENGEETCFDRNDVSVARRNVKL